MALTAPEALGGTQIKIGELILKTPLFTSEWGDQKLYFQHKNQMFDRQFWPREWKRLGEDMIYDKSDP